jgi:ferritin-like metal-binding protein YciE
MDSLQELYVHKLQDLYSAEQQITEALPLTAAKCTNEELRAGLEMHLGQTEQQREIVGRLIEQLGEKPGEEQCKGMQGILQEGRKALEEVEEGDALDALIIAEQQSVEHYEIAGYGTAVTWARVLGREDDARELSQILEQEKATDEQLTRIAESYVNREAVDGDREVQRGAAREGGQGGAKGAGQSGQGRQQPSAGR